MSEWTTKYTITPARKGVESFFRVHRQLTRGGPKQRLDYKFETAAQAESIIQSLVNFPTQHDDCTWVDVNATTLEQVVKTENSGGHCEYYHALVSVPENPGQQGVAYEANCEDIIQSLEMTFDEACEFKSLWRRARARQGYVKAESTPVRDAAKALHYAGRVLRLEQRKTAVLEARKLALIEEEKHQLTSMDEHWKSHPATGCSNCHGSGLNIHGHKCFCRGTN